MRGPPTRSTTARACARADFVSGDGRGGRAGHPALPPGKVPQATMSAMAWARTGTVAVFSPAMFSRLSLTM